MHCCLRRVTSLAAALLVGIAGAKAASLTEQQKLELLAAQNKYRTELNLPALRWSDGLASSAHAWAHHLASSAHSLVHSHKPGLGENLAMWTKGRASLTHLVDLWGAAEKPYFIDGVFPNVSRDGNWQTVAHYTQMIWRNTTEVGCSLAAGGGNDFLVCHYTPQGNIMGQRVY